VSILSSQQCRELERQINASLYERLLLSNDKESVLAVTRADKNDTLVKISLPEDNETILASKYELYLPSETALLEEIHQSGRRSGRSKGMNLSALCLLSICPEPWLGSI
jgi:hypothetical protein